MTGNFENLFEQLLTALQTAERRHRAVRDSASDNSDWNTYDSEGELISNIIKWRRSLEPLRTEIVASGAVADVDAPILPTPISEKSIPYTIDNSMAVAINDEEVKVGKYIRSKLRELSESGFRFSSEQIQQLCDVKWSRKIFTYPLLLPFAKMLNAQQNISLQTKDENGKNRYWNEVFVFGDISLLIISQWYVKDKESFDKWYDSLLQAQTTVSEDTLVFTKTVDWSTLNYGISVPVANWELFWGAIGQTINDGESCNISIDIKDSEMGKFKASVIHTVSGATNSVQIRYTQVSEIVAELRRIFKNTLDYCNRERDLNGENSRVFIPTDLAEHIDIYATGTPNTLRFVCSPRITTGAVDVDTAEPEAESTTIRTKPTKIILLGKEYSVRAWNEMFVKVCEVMLLHSPYIMAAMDGDNNLNTEASRNFSYRQSDMKRNGKRLSNGMWIETGYNQKDTLGFCRRIIEKCGFSHDELQVETMEV